MAQLSVKKIESLPFFKQGLLLDSLTKKCYNNLKGQKWSSGFIDRIYSCYLVLGWFEEKWSVY